MTANSIHALSVNVILGRADEEDRTRAAEAAVAVLDRAGVTCADAYAEYQRQWELYDDVERLTGLAALWRQAEEAACRALTEGWANPDGAHCSISA